MSLKSIIFIGNSCNKKTDQFTDVTNTRIVLVKDSEFPEEYRILTAFPIK